PDTTLAWIEPDGTISPLLHGANAISQVRISPDGKKAAFTQFSNTNNLHILDLAHTPAIAQRVSDGLYITRFAWSPDSTRVAFNASPAVISGVRGTQDVLQGVFTIAADGNSPASLLRRFPLGDLRVYDWSPDGKYIAISTHSEFAEPTDPLDTLLIDVEHPQKLQPALTTVAGEYGSVFSHDGRWIAYTHELHETRNVYIATFPACTPVHRLSTQGGYRPRWSHDDKTIYFLFGSDFYSAPIDISTSEPRIGQARLLHSGIITDQFDVAADGRVLANMRRHAPDTTLRIMTGVRR
ncbi:MAG: hypothetical protein NTV94_15060, partial [Planctomycetota bacterium]|nr:hypothetical protein [Planctomycetota bacterium]